MVKSCLFLSHCLFFNILFSSSLFLHYVSLFLINCFPLLVLDHLLCAAVLQVFLLPLHVHEVLLLLFFLLYVVYLRFQFIFHCLLGNFDVLFQLIFQSSILCLSELLFLFLLSLSLHLLLELFLVPLSLTDNVLCPFLCFLNFLPRL